MDRLTKPEFEFSQKYVDQADQEPNVTAWDRNLVSPSPVKDSSEHELFHFGNIFFFDRPTSKTALSELMQDVRSQNFDKTGLAVTTIEIAEAIKSFEPRFSLVQDYLQKVASLELDTVRSVSVTQSRAALGMSWIMQDVLKNPRISEIYLPLELADFIRDVARSVSQKFINSDVVRATAERLANSKSPISRFSPDPTARELAGCIFAPLFFFSNLIQWPAQRAVLPNNKTEEDKFRSVDGVSALASASVSNLFGAYLLGLCRESGIPAFSNPALLKRILWAAERPKHVSASTYHNDKFSGVRKSLLEVLLNFEAVRCTAISVLEQSAERALLAKTVADSSIHQSSRLSHIAIPEGCLELVDKTLLVNNKPVVAVLTQNAGSWLGLSIDSAASAGPESEDLANYLYLTERDQGFAPLEDPCFPSITFPQYYEYAGCDVAGFIGNLHAAVENRLLEIWNNFPSLFACFAEFDAVKICVLYHNSYVLSVSGATVDSLRVIILEDIDDSDSSDYSLKIADSIDDTITVTRLKKSSTSESMAQAVQVPQMAVEIEAGKVLLPIPVDIYREEAVDALRSLHTFPKVFKVLRKSFGVTLNPSRGHGSHQMLFRAGYGFPLGSKMYQRTERFDHTIGLKMLNALNISYEDFSRAVEG